MIFPEKQIKAGNDDISKMRNELGKRKTGEILDARPVSDLYDKIIKGDKDISQISMEYNFFQETMDLYLHELQEIKKKDKKRWHKITETFRADKVGKNPFWQLNEKIYELASNYQSPYKKLNRLMENNGNNGHDSISYRFFKHNGNLKLRSYEDIKKIENNKDKVKKVKYKIVLFQPFDENTTGQKLENLINQTFGESSDLFETPKEKTPLNGYLNVLFGKFQEESLKTRKSLIENLSYIGPLHDKLSLDRRSRQGYNERRLQDDRRGSDIYTGEISIIRHDISKRMSKARKEKRKGDRRTGNCDRRSNKDRRNGKSQHIDFEDRRAVNYLNKAEEIKGELRRKYWRGEAEKLKTTRVLLHNANILSEMYAKMYDIIQEGVKELNKPIWKKILYF